MMNSSQSKDSSKWTHGKHKGKTVTDRDLVARHSASAGGSRFVARGQNPSHNEVTRTSPATPLRAAGFPIEGESAQSLRLCASCDRGEPYDPGGREIRSGRRPPGDSPDRPRLS